MIIGMGANAIRGGQWKAFVPAKYHWINSDLINAVIYALTVYYFTESAWMAILSAPVMWLGANPGWGDYIGAMGGWRKDNLKEQWFIDWMLVKLKNKPFWWGFAGLAVRGLLWGAMLSIPFIMAHDYETTASFLIRGACMPLAYLAAIKYMKSRIPEGNWQGAGWGIGEIVFGYVLWGALD